MTPAERLRMERKVDALLASALSMRLKLKVSEYHEAGEPVPQVWRTAQRLHEEREALANAKLEAINEWS
jgi:hypothetical protein